MENPRTGYVPDPTLDRKGQIRKLFNDLCEEHEIKGWTLRFDSRPIKRYGQCRYRKKEIGITLWYALKEEWWKVEDTVRHEIAHILCPKRGHGPAWKEVAKALGAVPKACSKSSDEAPAPRYLGSCSTCSLKIRRHRLTQRMQEGFCPRCFPKRERAHLESWESSITNGGPGDQSWRKIGVLIWTDSKVAAVARAAAEVMKENTLPTDKTPADFTRAMILAGKTNAEIKRLLREHYPNYGAWKIAPSTYRRELKKKGRIS